jgi:tetratricopeptide (TPR) repeat protein
VKAADVKHVVVMLEASPTYLARRMKLLEGQLAGEQKMVISVSPSAEAARWKALAQVAEVRLWPAPFEALQQRSHLDRRGVQAQLALLLPFYATPSASLHRGRLLHLKGKFVGDGGAIHYYQLARPSNAELLASSADPMEKAVSARGKQDASYWSGLIAYQRANYPTAIDYFARRTLELMPDSPWTEGARYNLARTFEAAGDTERAILMYASSAGSRGYPGALLRAEWLKKKSAKHNVESPGIR